MGTDAAEARFVVGAFQAKRGFAAVPDATGVGRGKILLVN
jgi:hypothetical protein